MICVLPVSKKSGTIITSVVAEALKMYGRVNRDLAKNAEPLKGYQLDVSIGDNDYRKLAMIAEKIRRDIGLK